MRLVSYLVALLCLLPAALVVSSWLVALPPEASGNWQHVQNTVLPDYLRTTLQLVTYIMLLVMPLGVGAAWFVTHYEFPGRRHVQWLLIMPLALPGYISASAYGSLFDYAGPLQTTLRNATGWEKSDYSFISMRTPAGAAWVLGFAMLPYIYLLARAGFSSQSPAWREVAQSLGVNRARYFWKIALPAARPFIATGAALLLMETLADIGTVGVLGVPTLSSGIYRSWAYMHDKLVAARLAGILLLAVLSLLLFERASRRRIAYNVRDPLAAHMRDSLHGRAAFVAMAVCWLPVIAGFAVPLLHVVRMLWLNSDFLGMDALWKNTLDTLLLCLGSGALVCLLSLLLVQAERRGGGLVRYSNLVANLGYAVPGVVVAIGMLILFGWLREFTSVLLIGGLVGLFMSVVIRYLAVGYNTLHGAGARIPPEMDMAAASLGSSGWNMFRRVHLPLLRLPLCMAFILVALDVLKELPLTLILRPFGFKTLAISAYDFASDDRAAEAAPFAMMLIALAIILIFILQRLQQRERSYVQH